MFTHMYKCFIPQVCFYRAGDEGKYDLEFFFDSHLDSFSPSQLDQTMCEFAHDLPASHRSGRQADHLRACEYAAADPLLLRMQAGESMEDVLREM